jgi:hypothetical protein
VEGVGNFSSFWLISFLIVRTDIHSLSCFLFVLLVKLSVRIDSVLHGAELALAESASHELLGNDVDILVLLHEHLVGAEVGEAELVE